MGPRLRCRSRRNCGHTFGEGGGQSPGAASPGLVQPAHRHTPPAADCRLEEGSEGAPAQLPQASAALPRPGLQPPAPTAITQPAPPFRGTPSLTSRPVPVGVVPAQSCPAAIGMPCLAPVPVVGLTPSRAVALGLPAPIGLPPACSGPDTSSVRDTPYCGSFTKPPAQHPAVPRLSAV